jgi:ligand-binding sensor domain-containing protein
MRIKYLHLLVFCFSVFQLHAQNYDFTFRRVSPPGGFSFQAIRAFNQDNFGYIWMGSFDGVIRYNSKETVRFIHNSGESNGLPSNIITSIVIDNQNNIWVSTDEGLCLFNHKLQKFERVLYQYENGDSVSTKLFSAVLDGDGNLWIADENYFGYFDKKKNQLIRITKGLTDAPRLFYNDESNRLWLGTAEGSVYLVKTDEKIVVKKIEGPGSLTRTICTNNDEIWVGYESHGARLYDMDGNLKMHLSYVLDPKININSASVRKILRDTRGRIWIGTYYGLFLNIGKELFHFGHEDYEGIPHNSVFDLFEDKQGGIWIGTWAGGVAYLHHADNRFNNYRHSKEPVSISDNMVSSFTQTANGELLVGTERGGLNRFNLKTKSFEKILTLENEGVLNVKALCVDKNDGLWIACAFKGIYYRPKNQNNFIHFEKGVEDGQHVSALGVYALCKSDSGIWMGTNLGGINFYNFKTKKISFKSGEHPFSQLNNLNIRSLNIDSQKNLWISTERGVYRIHLPSGKSTLFNINSIGSFNHFLMRDFHNLTFYA